ncbi:MAG: 2,3-bisphosphoglycerate-independent phosphoglycerate mutase [Sphaerobacteraceae bacterium]|nr:MAG: 2,3-bisphosphoglycerate-independent phosphoglycerate mutase [Sphaerobacteraceae bacterium]
MIDGPVVLVILDGWGNAPDGPGNAISTARTPNMDRYLTEYPRTNLDCSGEDVGLPDSQMGNSEVGHLNIGAGFVVYQSITRIDLAIRDGSFAESTVLSRIVEHTRSNGSTVHLVGLVGDGGVHAHHRHWRGLLDYFASQSTKDVVAHAIMDGRDTEPTSGIAFMQSLLNDMNEFGVGRIATVSGRYYAMDRDKRWDRTKLAYDAIVHGSARSMEDPCNAIQASYDAGVTDEFLEPVVVGEESTPIKDGDAIVFVNFRADRMRQIVAAIADDEFDGFDRADRPKNVEIATMTQYERSLPVQVIFPPEDVEYPLARVISEAGLAQFHIAETEKYAHVTYFINGGREEPFDGEDREMVQSPDVPTYDHQPEMSAPEVTEKAVKAISSGRYRFVVINYANGDMVGHTGDFDAAVKAIETVDHCLGEIVEATLAADGAVIATADHGNAEEMVIPGTDDVWTAHTLNTVPLVLVSGEDSDVRNAELLSEGRLADIAPTVLKLIGVDPVPAMTGTPLVRE